MPASEADLDAGKVSGGVTGTLRKHLWLPLRDVILENYRKQQYPLGYSPALDGLRGLMTFGVILAHVRGSLVPGAQVYMDVFFVMSGYFITSLLLRDVERHGHIRYGEFYRRRFARILPPFAAMLAVYLAFCAVFFPRFADSLKDALIAFTYVANWWRAFDLHGLTYMSHTWSLAIEEQFYLLWPITLAVLIRACGVRWRLAVMIATGAALIWAWRVYLTWGGAPLLRLYSGLDTRADALLVGCGLAVVLKVLPKDAFAPWQGALHKLAWAFVGASVLATFFLKQTPFYYYVGITPLCTLSAALLLIVLLRSSGTILHRIFERPEAVFLGKIFYGMYLWHFPILFLMKDLTGAPNGARFFIGFPLTVLCATLSYVYIERHFMRVRVQTPRTVAPLPAASTSVASD
jgi:peptidoglycan/LPS O-acetylase OafA/YrhL